MTSVIDTSQLERTYQETPTEEKWPIQLFSIAQTSIEKHTLEVLYEHLIRCGGACHITPRRIVSTVAKRMKGVKANSKLRLAVLDLIRRLPWAMFWDNGLSHGGITYLERNVYALSMEKNRLQDIRKFIEYRKQMRKVNHSSLKQKIIDTLSQEFPLSPIVIGSRLNEHRVSISSRLQNLVKAGRVCKVATGFYCLPEDYTKAQEKLESVSHPFDMKILDLLTNEYPLTPSDITRRLQTSYSFILRSLNRLVRKQRVSRIRFGLYCLPSMVSKITLSQVHVI